MSETALVPTTEPRLASSIPFNVDKMLVLAKAGAASGLFKDTRDVNKALMQIVFGHELGFGPAASLSGIYIVQGKPSLSANLIAALVKRSGKYDFSVVRLDNKGCVLRFYQRGPDGKMLPCGWTSMNAQNGEGNWPGKAGGAKDPSLSSFLEEDAQAAGLLSKPGPWKQYPRNMYFARAMSNGQKWHCSDVSAGMPLYTPEEMGLDQDDDGNPLPPSSGSASEVTVLVSKVKLDHLKSLLEATGSSPAIYCQRYGVNRLDDLTDDAADAIIGILLVKQKMQHEQQQANTKSEQPNDDYAHSVDK